MQNFQRILNAPSGSFFLFGPRGTGKTSWAKQIAQKPLWINLLNERESLEYTTHPEKLIQLIDALPNRKDIVIDEIQKCPKLLDAVHFLIEKYKDKRFILTASSARKLRKGGVNLLGGRALMCYMHPYMASEIQNVFNLEKALLYGMVPLVWGSKDPLNQLRSYVSLYLQEEVRVEGLVRNLDSFSRFLEAITFSQGSPLNLSNISRDCHVNRKTVSGYLEILEDLLLSFRLPVFTKRAKRELAVHEKFYFFDCGVYHALRPKGFLDKPETISGITLESLVAQHLKAWCTYSSGNHKLFYWQTRSQLELDFVIYGESGLYAMEVKLTSNIKPQDLRPLKEFKKDYPEAVTYFIYRGQDLLLENSIMCVNVEFFLKSLYLNKLILI
jgi:predicted AAA+ superfamily ATPase